MAHFGSLRSESITTGLQPRDEDGFDALLGNPEIATLAIPETSTALTINTDTGRSLSENDIEDQFLIFQFSNKPDGPNVLETSQIDPALQGSKEQPDVRARIQLASFHIGENEEIDKNTRATLRVDFGKDEKSNSPLDTVFWSIAAGLKLYNNGRNKSTESTELYSDFDRAFSNRPIEIPGGLGNLSFEVVKHQEPRWWGKIFNFLQSDTGRTLTSAVGFPGITSQAVNFIDELLGRLDNSKPKPLFKSHPMTLALSEKAKSEYTGGIRGISIGSLSPGFCLLVRGRDFDTIAAHDPAFMGSYGLLRPKNVTSNDFIAGNYDDPFAEITYAVLRVAMDEAKLSFDLGF